MRKLTRIIAVLALIIATAVPATAQFRIGPRVGIAVNKLHFNKEVFDTNNRTGFTGGLEAEFMIPGLGLGVDASLMYVRRSAEMEFEATSDDAGGNFVTATSVRNLDYLDIPVYLKWKFGLPVVGSIVKPYVFTGPDFAFLLSSKHIVANIESGKCDVSWNFGLGVELFSHLQVGASYGIGMNKAAKATGLVSNASSISGKTRCWTVTAAYLF